MQCGLGRKKVVYKEGNQIRAIRGYVFIENDFVIVKDNKNKEPIWINKNVVMTIKNIV